MSSLDDKLRELLEDEESGIKHCCGQKGCDDIDADIAQIKQAFADELDQAYKNNDKLVASQRNMMTGQEFCDRFVKEWDTICRTIGTISSNSEEIPYLYGRIASQAAKRAAGISND